MGISVAKMRGGECNVKWGGGGEGVGGILILLYGGLGAGGRMDVGGFWERMGRTYIVDVD